MLCINSFEVIAGQWSGCLPFSVAGWLLSPELWGEVIRVNKFIDVMDKLVKGLVVLVCMLLVLMVVVQVLMHYNLF